MPAFIHSETFLAFKQVIDNEPFLKLYKDISFTQEEILLYYKEGDFHCSAAVVLYHICNDNDMNYTVLADPNLIKIKLWFYPQHIIEGSKRAAQFMHDFKKKKK